MFLSRIPTLFLLFKLSAALKISIQSPVTAGKDTPLSWALQPSDPRSLKFNLYVTLASADDNPTYFLENVDTDGKDQDSVNVNLPLALPGQYHILAFISNSADSDGPGGQSRKPQPDAQTDPFTIVTPGPLGISTVTAPTTVNHATSTSLTTSVTILTPPNSDGPTITSETITATGNNGRTSVVTIPVTVTRSVSSTSSAVGTPVGLSSSLSVTAPSSATSQAPSESTSSSNVPVIIGSIFGAIVAAAVLSLCCLVLFRRYRRRKNDQALFSAERMVRTSSPSESYLVHPEPALNEKTQIAYYGNDY